MKIPLRPSLLKIRRQSVKWIVLHHTSEMYPQTNAKIDNTKFQSSELFKGVLEQKSGDINYHYVVEKIGEDYYPIVARPFVYLCDWPDIDVNVNNRAIHIALLGNYDLVVPEIRLYEILSFRLLNPFMKMFAITPNRIKLHRDVTSGETTCPGDFVDIERIESLVRRFVIK